MSRKVAVPSYLSEAGKKVLRENNCEVIELDQMTNENILAHAKDIDGAILNVDPFSSDNFDQMPNLKILARIGVGYDNVDYKVAGKKGVWVTITPKANFDTTAEATMAALLYMARRWPQITSLMRAGKYEEANKLESHDIAGRTLGIIGYGRVGRALEKKAHDFGLKVIVNDFREVDPKYGRYVSKEELIKEADFISFHVPATKETYHMFDKEQFKQMKESAVLINFARGELINTEALIEALKNGDIDGAALDAHETEPLPLSNDLYKLNNVLLTPHIGGVTVECMARMARDAATEVVRVLDGKDPQWAINKLND